MTGRGIPSRSRTNRIQNLNGRSTTHYTAIRFRENGGEMSCSSDNLTDMSIYIVHHNRDPQHGERIRSNFNNPRSSSQPRLRATTTGDNPRPSRGRQRSERKEHGAELFYRFKKLEELSEKEPTTIVLEVAGNQSGFEQLLDSDLTNDTIVLVVKTLAKICSVDMINNKILIMNLAAKEKFHDSFIKFVFRLTVHDARDRRNSTHFWNDPIGFFENATHVFDSLIKCVPSRAREVLPKTIKACVVTINSLSDDDLDRTLALKWFKELENSLELCKVSRPKRLNVVDGADYVEDYVYVEPPDDFRHLSIYPTKDEILSERGFLRKNLIDRSYESVHHYLDVQFRLLKEDFVGPLREGIADPMSNRNAMGVLLKFQNQSTKSAIKFNLNKRFMYGSLLCFTKNNFESLLFGKVVDRTTELLQKGQVVVGFESDQEKYELGQFYVMIECSVYFEPYYHVLKALQNKDESQFSMKKYIIDLSSEIDDVTYLNQIKVDDLSHLNQTQLKAFGAALQKEFVVIQGPPGTGKTFLGTKIAQTLIQNKGRWYNSSPMLIVCYTNHALDQFLESLITTTNDIVRVGGQSKNKNLEQFTLRQKRRCVKRTRTDHDALRKIEKTVYEFLGRIHQFSEILKDAESNTVIINLKQLFDSGDNWFSKASKEEMIDWLLMSNRKSNRAHQRENVQNKEDQENDLHKQFEEMQYQQMKEKYEIDDGVDVKLGTNKSHILTGVSELEKQINDIKVKEDEINDETELFSAKLDLQKKRFQLEDQLEYLQMRLTEYSNIQVENKPESYDLENPHTMSEDDRWHLYMYFLECYKKNIKATLLEQQQKYSTIEKRYNELKDVFDLEVMKKMTVVGMTTTAAARLQTVLYNLKSPIVIVEEAAEVLESHVVVSLTSHCKHLILIGDHQQLRPSTSNYSMEVGFNLGISLFERMVRNKVQCHVLGVQHRMRPEIAKLVVPAIYPELENHQSVYNFPPIVGVVPNLFFIDHEFEEGESGDSSKLNVHEAKFLIAFARYLIQNGYKPEDVTILAAYSGQMFTLWKEQKKCFELLNGVRITVLDNYQGEESKIILLSLVRNNQHGNIGFLKIENRVCVALSRAREGFYMMGNMNLLCAKSTIWPKVRDVLNSQGSLGPSLILRCQIHPNRETKVRLPEDFNNVVEGVCHVLDREHKNFKCKAACAKILCQENHPCPKLCHEECGPCQVRIKRTFACGHTHKVPCHLDVTTLLCIQPVKTELPCGHVDPKKPCHSPADLHKCPTPCDTRVEPCGHACSKLCHFKDDPDHIKYECPKPCERPRLDCSTSNHKCPNKCFEKCSLCEIVIEKRRACTHKAMVPCNQDPNNIECIEKCKRLLPCGHACKKKCIEPCGGCKIIVTKVLDICMHPIRVECSQQPIRANCNEKCPLLLPCGHVCQNRCNEPCTSVCKALVDHKNRADCGHVFKIPCNMTKTNYQSNSFELLKFCNFPCTQVLSCEHNCAGTCGECAQGRIHKQCSEKCGAVLVCGHPCPVNCREECQPCNRNCEYRCIHSSCKKKCGESCTNCVEECSRKCVHVACKALCGDECTVPPCNKPCTKKLPCKHPCVGFCGDPCPPLCRICNHYELTEIFFGDEDDHDARFVVLNECGHVFESNGMSLWLEGDDQDQEKIAPKCCPRCRTILTSTQRYSDYIKKSLKDLTEVKKKFFGTKEQNDEKRTEIITKLNMLKPKAALMKVPIFGTVLHNFENAVNPIKNARRQPVSLMVLSVYLAKIQILENIVAASKEFKSGRLNEYLEFLLCMLLRNEKKLTKQELTDFNRETKRWSLLVQIDKIQRSLESMMYGRTELGQYLHDIPKIHIVTKLEFQQVTSAMGMTKGHWFKCPNGHIYAIGECGGAMQVGKCADCGEAIGGTSHSLLRSNMHAGEVDGSNFAAYSEEANNLMNYEDFQNL
ncbi:hypothetical protein FQR65_LT01344 [Abscondita terminalis]|nr:hypothetical protein FQR65_LT01344 [Abscondita terminalis]